MVIVRNSKTINFHNSMIRIHLYAVALRSVSSVAIVLRVLRMTSIVKLFTMTDGKSALTTVNKGIDFAKQ